MARPKANTTEITLPDSGATLPLEALKASIVAELAAGLTDVDGVKKTYNLSGAQWEKLRQNPVFRDMLKEAVEKFRGAPNASKRITMKAEIALEDSIPVLYHIAHDPQARSEARIDAVKTMGQMAGRNAKEGVPGASGSTFALNINIVGEQPITIEGKTVPRLEKDE